MPIVQTHRHHRIVKRPTRLPIRRVEALVRNHHTSSIHRHQAMQTMEITISTHLRIFITAPATPPMLLIMGWARWASRIIKIIPHHYCPLRQQRPWVHRSMWFVKRNCRIIITMVEVESVTNHSVTVPWILSLDQELRLVTTVLKMS